jgi:WD40 repeat protein
VVQTILPTIISTPSTTPIPPPTPTATYLPITPALPGTKAPAAISTISVENIDRSTLFARWGNGNASHAQYTANGEYLVVADSTGIYIYNTQDRSLVKYMDLGASVENLVLAPDDSKIAAATPGKVFILETDNYETVQVIDRMVSSLTFSPDGQTLALATYKRENGRIDMGNIELWDPGLGTRALEFDNSEDWIRSMVFSPDGKFLATAGYATKIWSADGQLLDTQGNYVSGGSTRSVSFSPDGTLLAEGADTENGLHIWRVLKNGRLVLYRIIPTHGDDVAISPDGKLLAVTGNGLSVWQLGTGKLKQQLSDGFTRYGNIVWSPDSKNIVTSSSERGIEIWDHEAGILVQNLNQLTGAITALSWLPDGKAIARATDNGEVALIDPESGNILQTFISDNLQNGFTVSPDSNWLAIKSSTGNWGQGVEIVNLKDNTIRQRLPNSYGAGLTNESFSRDGNYLVTSGFEGSKQIIQVWNTKDWNLYNSWVVGEMTDDLLFGSLLFNPDGQSITLYKLRDSAIKVYRISDGSLTQTIETKPNSISFSPDGQSLLSMSETWDITKDNSTQVLNLWRANDGSLAYQIDNLPSHKTIPPSPPYYHNLPNAIDWSPNGELFAVGFADGTIGIFRVSDKQLLQTLTGHSMRVTGVAFSPDGKTLASGSLDGTIRLWSIK